MEESITSTLGQPATGDLWRSRTALAAILAVAMALFALGVDWGLPSGRGWAVDEIHPADVERAARQGYSGGWHGRYPPLQFQLLAALYAVADPGGGRPPPTVESTSRRILLARCLSLAQALGILAFVYLIGSRLVGRRAAVFALAILAGTVPLVYYAKTANLETPYLFWFSVSLYAFSRLLDEHRWVDYLLFSAAATLAICTKDQAYGLYLLTPVAIALSYRRSAQAPSLRGWLARLLACAALAVFLFAWIYRLPGNQEGLLAHLRTITGPASVPYREFEGTWASLVPFCTLVLRQAAFALGGPQLALAATAVIAAALRLKEIGPVARRLLPLLWLPISYSLFFLLPLRYTYVRFQLPACLVLALFGGVVLARLWSTQHLRILSRVAVALVVAWGLARAATLDHALLNDSRYRVERWVRSRVAESGGSETEVVSIGLQKHAARFPTVHWRRVLRDPEGFLASRRPSLVVIDIGGLGNEGRQAFHRRLAEGELGYRKVLEVRPEWPWPLAGRDTVRSNFQFISPDLDVFERIETASPGTAD